MKIVVVGSGGREHALAEVLGRHHEVVVAPGNPGIPGSTDERPEDLVDAGGVDLVVVGPEQPLVAGLADRLRAKGVAVLGPGADGARLEGSKAFMKLVVEAAGVPTARYDTFTEVDAARSHLLSMGDGPYVIKTDGLAAGKGVLVAQTLAEAEQDVARKLAGDSFGEAGLRVVIEECLAGPEVSVFAICDGTRAVCLPAAQDFKRVGDGDEGPNTGGMGAWSPLPFLPEGFEDDIRERFVEPTLAELTRRGIDYRGVLYAGLILTDDGPKLIEYNVRFGDPDSQPVLLRMTSDLGDLLLAAAQGDLSKAAAPTFDPDDVAVLVVAASEGYPRSPRTGDVIEGLDAARAVEGVTVLAAGVGADPSGALRTAGGRVLNVVATASHVEEARARAYRAIGELSWPGMHHRTDIAAG